MKKINRFLSILFAMLLIASMHSFSLAAYALNGMGTHEHPYLITTAAELQAVNQNPAAHYKLAADIDLRDQNFIPIGNADDGAFSGSFDGNGFTIRNLNVFAGKYAGLFGYSEGAIQNVSLEGIYVYGTRYVGGVVGHNSSFGTVQNCSVTSGEIEAKGGIGELYAGGIVGLNSGLASGKFSNRASVTANHTNSNAFAGGIIGRSDTELAVSANNFGDIMSSVRYAECSYAGGLVGSSKAITAEDSYNTGNVFSSGSQTTCYSGGLIGYNDDIATVINSYNTGHIDSQGGYVPGAFGSGYTVPTYSGGLIGYSGSALTSTNCSNTGNISSTQASGGLAGCSGNTIVTNGYNTGSLTSIGVNRWSCSGGLIGSLGSRHSFVINSYNTGSIYSYYAGGLVGNEKTDITVTNSYTSSAASIVSTQAIWGVSGEYRTERELQNSSLLTEWDFADIWTCQSEINSGFPTFKTLASPLSINISNTTILKDETLQLRALKNGVAEDVSWSVTSGTALVSSTGLVFAEETGEVTITATDAEGNKANCNIHVMCSNESVALNDFAIKIRTTSTRNVAFGNPNSNDYLVSVASSDSDILSVTGWGGVYCRFVANAPGTVTISFETAQGRKGACTATVTNYAESLSLPSSITIVRGETSLLPATTTPAETSSVISWRSSDERIATVDSSGNVTGVSAGKAIITAKTDNGLQKECVVTVHAPVKDILFTKGTIEVPLGLTDYVEIVTDPIDPTDQITFSSNSSCVSIDSATGKVTGNSIGTAIITAKASSGVTAKCCVTVVNIPVVVTDVTLDQSEFALEQGYAFQLKAAVSSDVETNARVSWASSNSAVATVNNDGVVIAVAPGTADITASAGDGYSAQCVVTVTGTEQPASGDVNGDSKVNSRDVAALQKHILETELLTGDSLAVADVNGDGKINSRDVAELQKRILEID